MPDIALVMGLARAGTFRNVPGRPRTSRSFYALRMLDFEEGMSRRRDTFVYLQIAGVLEDAIRSGELSPGEPVPSEKELQDLTGAGRNAVRQAIAHLRDKGLVYTVPHLRSFVRRTPPATPSP
jgi:DNA-binding GntR family transcriptional regulator